jgi:hypothetical protein
MLKRLVLSLSILVIISLLANPAVAKADDNKEDKNSTNEINTDWLGLEQMVQYSRKMLESSEYSLRNWITGLGVNAAIDKTVPQLKFVEFFSDIKNAFKADIMNPVDALKKVKPLIDIGSFANPSVGILDPLLRGYHGFWMTTDTQTTKLLNDFKSFSQQALKNSQSLIDSNAIHQKFIDESIRLRLMQQNLWPFNRSGTRSMPSYQPPKISVPSYQPPKISVPSYQPPKISVPSYQPKFNSGSFGRR